PQGSRAAELPEHNSPPAASVQVMRGSLRVTGQDPVVLQAGAPEALTHSRHAVEALEDTVFLPTTVTWQQDTGSHATSTGEMLVFSVAEPSLESAERHQGIGGGLTDH